MTNATEPNVTIKPETSSDKKRIIKINECPTLSNNSTLTYHTGCDGEDDSIYFRIIANTKAGLFNDEWISLSDIQ